jgi:myo-inositol 2-dehydrogenase/D-chiro-inositol 1-dehydrogenase
MSPLRIAVIGAGSHSALHHGSALRSYAALHPGEIELAAVCDLDGARAEEYAARFGFARIYRDYRAMIARERPHGLVAVTPMPRTAAIVEELLAFGIPLVIEKPPGESSADTRRLLETAERRGTPHLVSFNRRFIPAMVRAREWIDAGGAARAPRLVVARMLRHARREPGFPVGTGIHLVDTVLSFMGRPRRIATAKVPTDYPDRFLSTTVFDFGSGRSAAVVLCPDVGTDEETFEIQGQGYAVQVDSMHCTVRIVEDGREVCSWQPERDAAYEFLCGALGETERFVAALRDGRGFAPDLREALVSMRSSEAIEAGGVVAFEEDR